MNEMEMLKKRIAELEARLNQMELSDRYVFKKTIQILDGRKVQVGVSTGTMIATAGGTSGQKLGFFGATPVVQRTGVAVTAGGIHAALVTLGLITA